LFKEHGRDLLGYALRRAAGREDAADVVAETFLVAWRRLDAVPAPPGDRLWLFGVARRALANQVRGERRRDRLTEQLRADLLTRLPARPEETPAAGDLAAALARLSESDREVLRLTFWEQLDPGEVARVLGVPAVTARGRLHRARRRLSRELESGGEAGAPANDLEMGEA
jgi:RNA polymerase sigma-70 factor (ECF subfamily)